MLKVLEQKEDQKLQVLTLMKTSVPYALEHIKKICWRKLNLAGYDVYVRWVHKDDTTFISKGFLFVFFRQHNVNNP